MSPEERGRRIERTMGRRSGLPPAPVPRYRRADEADDEELDRWTERLLRRIEMGGRVLPVPFAPGWGVQD
jgi:hypothetical protein